MKRLIILMVLLSVSINIHAQQIGDIEIGLFGGASVSNIVSAQDLIESNLRFGVNGGVSADYYFTEFVSLELEAFYNQNGRVIDPMASNDSQISRTLTLHYITVALLPNYHFGQDFNWYVMAGPYFSFLSGANQGTAQVKEEFKGNDIGLTGGLGYEFPISANDNTSLFIEVVHQLGLSNIVKDNVNEDIRNTRTSLNLGITFL
ncbi:MAG: PorT family protein [Flavobacteriaceae bacterium]|nr:PorT family protein [Flavobacteriaceae bacterium]